MPRNYCRKQPERTPVTEAQISHAKELLAKGKSKRAAASAIGISESCLRKRLKLDTTASSLGRWKPTFNPEQEAEFVEHCKKMDERYFGLTITDLRRLAYEYAQANKIENRFDSGCKMAGRDWVESFLKRHPDLTLRQSTATSLARVIGFNKVQVDRFYQNLKEIYDRHKFKPNRIYNVDETGMSTVPKKTPKVVSTKGKKVVGKVVSAERGITVTAICCMSATGHYVPPAFIFPRKRTRDDLLNDAPSQSICMVSDSGFVNTDLFITWLKHFQSFVHATPEDPVLLLLDNHSSHISLEAVNYAREQNIVMLTLPPHGSHKLQPLDRSFFSPLKSKYSVACNKFMSEFPGKAITQYHVAKLFNEAYKKVATVGNAESGFKVSGIYPFDDDLFSEADFAPSSVTDQMVPDDQQSVTVAIEPSKNDNNQSVARIEAPSDVENSGIEQVEESLAEYDPTTLMITNSIDEQLSTEAPSSSTAKESTNTSSNKENQNQHVSISTISPFPKMKEKRRRTNRVAMKSQIITCSPYKQQLQEKKRLEEEKKKPNKKIRKPALGETEALRRKNKKIVPAKKKLGENPKTPNSNSKKYFCPLCGAQYTEPPTEEWIQCIKCMNWWHEQCTFYEGGSFECDHCHEDSS